MNSQVNFHFYKPEENGAVKGKKFVLILRETWMNKSDVEVNTVYLYVVDHTAWSNECC